MKNVPTYFLLHRVGMLGIPFYGDGISAAIIGFVVLIVLYFALNYGKTVDKKASSICNLYA